MLAESLENLLKKEQQTHLQKGLEQGLEQGRQEGERVRAEQTARNLLSFSVLTDEQIAKATGLSLDEVVALRIEHKH